MKNFQRLCLQKSGLYISSRPLVTESINDADSDFDLSSSHLFTMKSKAVMPPFSVFGMPDLYCKNTEDEYSTSATNFGVDAIGNSWQH